MNADPRYTKDQVKVLKRVIERCKKANDVQGIKYYTELLKKGNADINETVFPLPQNTDK